MYGIKIFYDYCEKFNKKVQQKISQYNDLLQRTDNEEEKEKLVQQLQQAQNRIFKPIFGCEAYVAKITPSNPNGSRHVKSQKENQGGHHLVVLAKNKKGYQNLCKLVSLGWMEGKYSRPRIDRELLTLYAEGLIVCSACIAGEINRKIRDGKIQEAKEAAIWYKNLFGDDFYIELQLHKKHLSDPDTELSRQQLHNNAILLKIAKELNIKTIATNDIHFVKENHAQVHDRLICLSTGKDLDDPDRMRYSMQEWMKSPQQMAELFPETPESIENTHEIANKVEHYSLESPPLMPAFPIPEDFATEESYKKQFTHEDLLQEFEAGQGGEGRIKKLGGFEKVYRIKLEADYLRLLTLEGANKKYKDITPEIQEQIDFELSVIKNMGFPGYFLIVQDFITQARKMNICVGPGRGSAAGSIVSYCLNITTIDPIQYDLLFERFLNPDRISLPDIDVDFDDEGRSKILQWVTDKYGEKSVAHIVTYGTMGAKSSIKDVARVQKLPLEKSNQLTKMIPDRFSEDPQTGQPIDVTIENCIQRIPEFAKEYNSEDTNIATTIQYANMLEGTVRQTGVHACGIIVTPDELINHAPLATQKDTKTGEDILVTQYEGTALESIGLIKMDFLALKTLTIIQETIENIKKSRGIEIDIDNIPADDQQTFKLFSEGATVALFQFESAGMQKCLKELKPNSIKDLIAMNALYRPGPMQYINSFTRRKHGLEDIQYDFPIMEKRLKETYGITVYQEQVMLLSRDLANFTRGQSDELRKAMGKKDQAKMAALKAKFLDGATQNGFSPLEKLEKIWADWAEFAKYAFNKSHAACYSWVAYQTGYLKANFTAEFMAANLTHNLSDVSEIALLISDCKRIGIKVLGPDINESERHFTVNSKGEIRFGLGGIRGVGDVAVEEIVHEKNTNGRYVSVLDFVQRMNPRSCNKRCLESLAQAGCFDALGNAHRAQFFVETNGETFISKLIKYASKYQTSKIQNQTSLFDDMSSASTTDSLLEFPSCRPWTLLEKAQKEKEIAGFYVSGHPLDDYKREIRNFCSHSLATLKESGILRKMSGGVFTFAAIVIGAQKSVGKKGREFGKILLEDFSDTYEMMLWEDDLKKYWSQLNNENAMVYITAKSKLRYGKDGVQDDDYRLEITDVLFLDTLAEKIVKHIEVEIPLLQIDDELTEQIEKLMQECQLKNGANVSFLIKDSDKKISCTLASATKVHVTTFPSLIEELLNDEKAVILKK
jgi:DNA polymerase-3 subunit alpha